MQVWRLEEILTATAGECRQTGQSHEVTGISTDSRTIQAGQAFVALVGEQHDGHDFLESAVERGAHTMIVERHRALPPLPAHVNIITVADTTAALGELARYHRQRYDLPVIGITGSYGKTTVKEISAHLLAGRYQVLKSQKSYNNFIGVPLTLLQLQATHQVAVIEMGANAPGEIAALCRLAQPTMGVLTAIGECHLEGFGDLAGVARAKNELLQALPAQAPAFIWAENSWCRRLAQEFHGQVHFYGQSAPAQIKARLLSSNAQGLTFQWEGHTIQVPIMGFHNLNNLLAGIAVARYCEVTVPEIISRLATFRLPPMRLAVEQIGSLIVINDAYNANPAAMLSALNTLIHYEQGRRKVAILGSMLELGQHSERLHRQVGQQLCPEKLDLLFLVGAATRPLRDAAVAQGFPTQRIEFWDHTWQACQAIPALLKPGDVILLKGSRRVGLEQIVTSIRNALRD